MKRVAVLTMALLATAAFAADKKTYRYVCKDGAFAVAAVVDASGRWSRASPPGREITRFARAFQTVR